MFELDPTKAQVIDKGVFRVGLGIAPVGYELPMKQPQYIYMGSVV